MKALRVSVVSTSSVSSQVAGWIVAFRSCRCHLCTDVVARPLVELRRAAGGETQPGRVALPSIVPSIGSGKAKVKRKCGRPGHRPGTRRRAAAGGTSGARSRPARVRRAGRRAEPEESVMQSDRPGRGAARMTAASRPGRVAKGGAFQPLRPAFLPGQVAVDARGRFRRIAREQIPGHEACRVVARVLPGHETVDAADHVLAAEIGASPAPAWTSGAPDARSQPASRICRTAAQRSSWMSMNRRPSTPGRGEASSVTPAGRRARRPSPRRRRPPARARPASSGGPPA